MTSTAPHTTHLLIATGLYPPDMGGPATYTVFLEKHLPQFGIKLTVVPFGEVRKYPKLIRHLVYLWRLIRRAHEVDFLYALDTVSVGLPVMIASAFTRTPYLLRVPGDYAWEQGQQRFHITETLDEYLVSKHHPWKVKVLAWIQYRVAKGATKIVVPSEYMKKVVSTWGIDSRKITCIYSALKAIDVPESKETLRAQLGYEGLVVVTAARLVPWKGVGALIEVIVMLRERGVNVSLEVIGDGTSRPELEERVKEKGMCAHIHFRGVMERNELGKYLKAGDVFVLNTSYEGLSHQLLEVMSLGTPVVTTPVGGNVELITHEKDGLLVPFNDVEEMANVLMKLKNNLELRTLLATQARERVMLFHEDVVVKKFVALIKPQRT